MTLLLLAAAVAGASSPAVAHSTRFKPPAANCPQTVQYYAWQRDRKMVPHRLTELPDANVYKAVYRQVNGCEVPVVVRYGVTGR